MIRELKNILSFFSRKFVFSMIALLLIQQGFSSMGIASLSFAGKNLDNKTNFFFFLSGYLVFICIPNGLTILIRKIEMRGYWEGYYKFFEEKIKDLKGNVEIWKNQDKKQIFNASIGPEFEKAIAETVFPFFEVINYFFSILFTALTVSFLVDLKFLLILLFCGLLGFLIYSKLSERLQKSFGDEQFSRIKFFEMIANFWDNVLLNNSNCYEKYHSIVSERQNKARHLIEKAYFQAELFVFLIYLVIYLPIIGFNIYILSNIGNSPGYLVGVLVTLPRQLSLVNEIRVFFHHITNLKSGISKVKIFLNEQQVEGINLETLCNWEKLKINKERIESLDGILEKIQKSEKGRYCITGANGSGKSSLLLQINGKIHDSFYLPAFPDLEIGSNLSRHSSGEKISAYFDYIDNLNCSVLLLDEWDANLDSENFKILNQKIESLSKNKLVIEVRHKISEFVI